MKYKTIVIVCIWLLQASNLFAQQEGDVGQFFFAVEGGLSRGHDYFFQMGGGLEFEKDYYKVRVAAAFDEPSPIQKQTFKEDKECGCMDSKGVTDYGFIYGRSFSLAKRHLVQFGGGISIITRTDPDEVFNTQKAPDELDQYLKKHAFGLPFEVKYAFQLGRNFALTSSMNLNINRIKSYTGVSAGVAFKSFFN